MDILTQWQLGYCAGSKMPMEFRKKASEIFQDYYNQILTDHQEFMNVLEAPQQLFRVLSGHFDPKLVCEDLYYSFSGSAAGIMNFARKDRYLLTDLTLIITRPNQSLNFNLLCGIDSRYDSTSYRREEHRKIGFIQFSA